MVITNLSLYLAGTLAIAGTFVFDSWFYLVLWVFAGVVLASKEMK